MNRIALFFVSFILLTSCSEAQETTETATSQTGNTVINKVVSPEEFKKMLGEDIQLVDVRTPEEFAAGKIDGAQNVNYLGADFKREIDQLDKNKKTLIYCASGRRSGNASAIMKDLGFKEVYDLQGGYSHWPY